MNAAAPEGTLVVAGSWVRAMAESAARAGWRVIAMDLFGDRDTRRVSIAWRAIGDASRFTIDGEVLGAGLRDVASRGGAVGWVAGSGFEGDASLLSAHGELPLIGMDGARTSSLRDPRRWFDALDRLGLKHPPVVFDATAAVAASNAWLVKSMRASGGWHIRSLRDGVRLREGEVVQQRVKGRSVSALFLADGARARIVGISAQDVRALGAHPLIYHGAIGPIGVADEVRACLQQGLDALVPAFGVRGLASADVIVDADQVLWLEINPRPSATMVLYDDLLPQGLMHAHVAACRGEWPSNMRMPSDVRGHRIVYAERCVDVDEALADALASRPDRHDLPMPGTRVAAGEPLCSVSARAAGEATVRAALEALADEALALCAPRAVAATS